MINYIPVGAALAFAAVLIGLFFLLKRKGVDLSKIIKPAGVVLFLTAFVRYVYREPVIYNMMGLSGPKSPFNEGGAKPALTAFAVILLWFSYAAILITVMSAFYNYKTLRRMVNFFALPVYAALLVAFNVYGIVNLGNEGFNLSSPRVWIMAAEIGLGIAIAAGNSINDKCFELPKRWADFGNLIYGTFFAVLAIMPCYVPQMFITNVDNTIHFTDISFEHRLMLYGSMIVPFIIFHLLKNKPVEVNRCILTYMSLALMWSFMGNWNFEDMSTPVGLPLHLCHTAMFLIPLCLVFNMKRLYNFCLFINVIGALLAMLMPDVTGDVYAIETGVVHFWINHYAAFFMPILLVALGVFKRPKFKEWIYAVIALVAYFCAMLFANAYFSVRYNEECDFFFLNSDHIVSQLGEWAEKTRDIVVNVPFGEYTLTFYPLYQSLFIAIYILFTLGIWFLYAMLFASWDKAKDRRDRERDYKRMKKDLKKYLGDKSEAEPISGDASPSLVLKHFSKRYGANKHYSVNDVSFEVKGGEIFGFLGPNGAGKSTIIKSMVGIQTITSGNIEICGYDVEKQPVAAKLNTAFVPDHYALYENLTGREYVNYIADLFGVPKQERDETIERLVERFQLVGSFDNQMKTYSHGMKQKITIMSALVHNPKVWILDEPLTGLDPTSIHEVKECMKEHAAKGNIVFFSSHIIDVVEKLCDKIAIIKKGQLRAYTTISELNEKGIELEQFYLDIINDGNDEHVPYVESEDVQEGKV